MVKFFTMNVSIIYCSYTIYNLGVNFTVVVVLVFS